MGKNVAVFVDVANIFYAAKAAGVDIDYVTLLKASSAGRDLVRAYAYTGLDPDNENQRNFHDFLRRHGYRVVSKDIRKYGDGKVKANLDIELVVDMMKTARNLDVAIVVSGDGDFAPAIRAVQEQGVRVEVVSFRGNTSSDLMDVADLFTDITQIAKVEKGSSRSGRRVADDDMDLSMTEVPDKQSEGTGERTRGRGRSRRTEPVAASSGRGRGRTAAPVAAMASPAVVEPSDGTLVVLPGEKLSRAASRPARPAAAAQLEDVEALEDAELEDDEALDAAEGGAGEDGLSEEARRRRRRRGGRGRGRGRGREDGALEEAPAGGEVAAVAARSDADAEDADEEPPAPARRAASAFGSVWDSQIGVRTTSGARGTPLPEEDEDFDEPSVPEYLITERRQRDDARSGQRGGRGRGGAYAAALDRERFGGGRGSTPSRFAEPAQRRDTGFGRPDRQGRDSRPDRGGPRPDRGGSQFRNAQPRPAPRPTGDEPWSEVPPEIEAMLRAQMGTRPAPPARPAPTDSVIVEPTDTLSDTADVAATAPPSTARRGRRAATGEGDAAPSTARTRTRRTTAAATSDESGGGDAAGSEESAATAASATRRTSTRRTRTSATSTVTAPEATEAHSTEDPATATGSTSTGTRRTSTRSRTKVIDAATAAPETLVVDAETTAPKKRTTRTRKTEPA